MKGTYGKLAALLVVATSVAQAEHTRLYWEGRFNPFHGYRNIKHRSQKKLRRLARQHGAKQ